MSVVALLPTTALAVHDARLFELDGNALDASSAGDDWGRLFPTDGSSTEVARAFGADAEPADKSYFTGGGSKDPNAVSAWRWTTGDVAPDKSEITNAYAAAYRARTDTGRNDVGDLLVYFGMDRFANDGTAQVGFWFFRSTVSLKADGTFAGAHTVGDVLVLADFTQGGRIPTVKVYKWVGAGGSDGTLDLLLTATGCTAVPADDAACAIVNSSPAGSPWAYTPKAGSSGTFPTGSFFEGGINITRLTGVTCLKSFMGETRSSQTLDAQLKDFTLAGFDTCPRRARVRPTPRPTTTVVTASGTQTLPASGDIFPIWLLLTGGVAFIIGLFLLWGAYRRPT